MPYLASFLIAALFSTKLAVGAPTFPSLHDPAGPEPVTTLDAKNTSSQRPTYAIAHRVLTMNGVRAALKHGANAIEIDMCAGSENLWWADHDCIVRSSRGDKAEDMFTTIAEERRKGTNVGFVWLDLKNPDYCKPGSPCSIEALRQLARDILEPAGIQVLYGFYKLGKSRSLKAIHDSLNNNEAMALSGKNGAVLQEYKNYAPSVPQAQRIMDYGYFNLGFQFGDCQEKDYFTCTELRQGAISRDQNEYGKVFGWTAAVNQNALADRLLGTAKVDGLIYGFKLSHYYDHDDTRRAASQITDWVKAHPDTHRMATNSDRVW